MLYLISDLHLGHGNIIGYEDRPFESAAEMDETLISLWNETVQETDEVLFGGDLTLANKSTAIKYLEQLNGDITFIYGNHDKLPRDEVIGELNQQLAHTVRFTYDSIVFYYTHWPQNLPLTIQNESSFWGIHGHVHGSDDYPFIDQSMQRVNVSVEKLNYRPISIQEIVSYIQSGETYQTRPVDDEIEG